MCVKTQYVFNNGIRDLEEIRQITQRIAIKLMNKPIEEWTISDYNIWKELNDLISSSDFE